MTEHVTPPEPNSEPSPEREPSVIDTWPNRLGIMHTDELTAAQKQAVEAIRRDNAEARREAFTALDDELLRQVDAMPAEADREPRERTHIRGGIGRDITKALVWRDANDIDHYRRDLQEVYWYVDQLEMTDLAADLNNEFTRIDSPDRIKEQSPQWPWPEQ